MGTDLVNLTRGKWRGLLESLGIDPIYLSGRNGPCPMCDGVDRWRFTNHNDDGMWWCNHCGTGNGFQLLQRYHGWSFPEAKKAVEALVPEVGMTAPQRDDRSMRRSIERLRTEAASAGDVPEVVQYLTGRGLVVPPNLEAHPKLPYYENGDFIGRYPAMLGTLTSKDGELLGYHRTYLSRKGTKAPLGSPRKLLKLPRSQSYAIRLWPVTDTVCIAEGIETAIACYMLWGYPAWSVSSANEMMKFEPPEGITKIMIAGDNDASHTGQEAAYSTARRLIDAGYQVEVRIPQSPGDWADVLDDGDATPQGLKGGDPGSQVE
ncbi:MAG: toprim domain-containing protein [Gammaproteobacteria bacterium]|nr:toprim domain-containing protein [Gammaproteobacteria bacterium]